MIPCCHISTTCAYPYMWLIDEITITGGSYLSLLGLTYRYDLHI